MREMINNSANNQPIISKTAFQFMQSRHKITLNQRDMQILRNIFPHAKYLLERTENIVEISPSKC
jgi:predicted transcriptional regulator with HTH domain